MTISCRPAVPEDRAFIVDSWVESYRHCHAAGLIPMPHYNGVYRAAVNWLLDRPGVAVTVAVDDDMILGWVAVEADPVVPVRRRVRTDGRMQWTEQLESAGCPMVLYCFVKDAFRRHGIARALFAAAKVDLGARFLYASKTPAADRLKDKFPHARWDPLAARFPKT